LESDSRPSEKAYTVFIETGILNKFNQIITYRRYVKRSKIQSLGAALEIARLLYRKRLKSDYEFLKMRCFNANIEKDAVDLFDDGGLHSNFD